MKLKLRPVMVLLVMVLGLLLAQVPGLGRTALAASEDVAMFYDELGQYGEWTEYENYGPVWRPNRVQEDWRPYTDGRWVPTKEGYVFETKEPWGWATYHYGNWMPTSGHGWVWVPGRTWYPSTVQWRTSPEDAPVDSSYVGWAPIPPANYEPPPGYAPASYSPGTSPLDLLTAPFWIFAKAASFLLGFGQPYTPAYSYADSGILMPTAYVPVFYPQTVFVSYYMTPLYYPPAYYRGHRLGYATYCWGPPVGYISRVTNINTTVINQTITYNSVNITRIGNVVPPAAVVSRHAYLRQIMPPALAQGRPLPASRRVENISQARASLYRPNILPAPANVPAVRGNIPRLQPVALQPGRAIPGTGLPARATLPLTPHMADQIRELPQGGSVTHAAPAPVAPGHPAGAATVQPGSRPAQPGQPHVTGPIRTAPPQGEVGTRAHTRPVAPGTSPGRVPAGQFNPAASPAPQVRGVTPEQPRQSERERHRPVATTAPQPTPRVREAGPNAPQPQLYPRRQPVYQPAPVPATRQLPPAAEPRSQMPRPQPQIYQPRVQPQPQVQTHTAPQVRPAPPPRVQPQVVAPPKPQPQAAPPPATQSRPQAAPPSATQSRPQPPPGHQGHPPPGQTQQ